MADNIDDISGKLEGLDEEIQSVNDALAKTPEYLNTITAKYKDAVKQAEELNAKTVNYFNNLTSSTGAKLDLNNMITALKGNPFEGLSTQLNTQMESLTASGGEGLKTIGALAAASQIQVSDAVNSMASKSMMGGQLISDSYMKSLTNSNNMILSVVGSLSKHVEAQNKMENGLLSTLGTAGGLNQAYQIMGDQTGRNSTVLQNLDTLTAQYNARLAETGTATGLLAPEVGKYNAELMKIPGAYSAITTVGGKSMTELEAAIKVSRGTTQNFGDVVGFLDKQYEQFNQTQGESLDVFSAMFQSANDLGFRFNILRDAVGGIRDSFAMMGDQSSSALNILESFTPALKESGLGPAQISNLVKDVTGAVASLDVAQKSFLSSASGGPGGLRGGFAIDLKLQEGKLDEVVGQMQDALQKQMGGNIVGLEEASQSDTGAAQMQKQLSLLRSGPFGGVVKSDAEAYKFLEMMQKGVRPTDSAEFKEKTSSAMGSTMETSRVIQERQTTALLAVNNEAIKQTSLLSSIAANTARGFLGTSGSFREGIDTLSANASSGQTVSMPVMDKDKLASELVLGLQTSVDKINTLFRSATESKTSTGTEMEEKPKEINLTVQVYNKDGVMTAEDTRKLIIEASEENINRKAVIGSNL